MRIFIDIDDTLILWDSPGIHPYGGKNLGDESEVNESLVTHARRHAEEGHQLIFWSGGGKDYAEEMVTWLIPDLAENAIFLTKNKTAFPLVQPDDIVVDDQPITVRTHTPLEDF